MTASLVAASLAGQTTFVNGTSVVVPLNFTARENDLIVLPIWFRDRFSGLAVGNFAAPGWTIHTTTAGVFYILTKVAVGGETTATITYNLAQISYNARQMLVYGAERVPSVMREVTSPNEVGVYTRSIDACVGSAFGTSGVTSWTSPQDTTWGSLFGDFDNPILTLEITTFPGTLFVFGLGFPLQDPDDVHPSMASRV